MATPKINLVSEVVVRRRDGKLYLMNTRATGWQFSSIPINSEKILLRVFNVQLGEWTRDEYSEYCPVHSLPRSELPTLHDGEKPASEMKVLWEIADVGAEYSHGFRRKP
jgi:hypothetical protein